MQKTAIAAGLALVLAGLAVPAMAYHIHGDPIPAALPTQTIPCQSADSSLEWCLGSGVLIICEQDDFIGIAEVGAVVIIKTPGQGGLCFMSNGHENVDDLNTAVNEACTSGDPDAWGRSDGTGYSTQSPGGSELTNNACVLKPANGTFIAFSMTDFNGGSGSDVEWTAQAGLVTCDDDVLVNQRLHVDELYLWFADSGHLAGFPAPGTPEAAPLTEGTYNVDVPGTTFAGNVAGCDGTGVPMHIAA